MGRIAQDAAIRPGDDLHDAARAAQCTDDVGEAIAVGIAGRDANAVSVTRAEGEKAIDQFAAGRIVDIDRWGKTGIATNGVEAAARLQWLPVFLGGDVLVAVDDLPLEPVKDLQSFEIADVLAKPEIGGPETPPPFGEAFRCTPSLEMPWLGREWSPCQAFHNGTAYRSATLAMT